MSWSSPTACEPKSDHMINKYIFRKWPFIYFSPLIYQTLLNLIFDSLQDITCL